MAMSNRTTRILVSILAIPIIILVCYFGKLPFLVFTLLIGNVAFYEFATMVKNKQVSANIYGGLISVSLLILNQYFAFIEMRPLLLIIAVLLFFAELFRNKQSAINNLGATLIGIFYIGLFSAAILGIREIYPQESAFYINGGYLIIGLLISIWVCDSAAYFIGSAIGKHKLFPRVSPNKSWEGAIAGFVFSIIALAALKTFMLSFLTWADVVLIGMLVGIFGQVGDLIESLLKRDAEVKDSSALIPGHGGIFDRFDSLLYTAPIVYLYLHYFSI